MTGGWRIWGIWDHIHRSGPKNESPLMYRETKGGRGSHIWGIWGLNHSLTHHLIPSEMR